MDSPSREEIIKKFNLLLQGDVSREEIATWAQKWVIADEPPEMEKSIWEALQFLSTADLISLDRPYLYSLIDFEKQLSSFYSATLSS